MRRVAFCYLPTVTLFVFPWGLQSWQTCTRQRTLLKIQKWFSCNWLWINKPLLKKKEEQSNPAGGFCVWEAFLSLTVFANSCDECLDSIRSNAPGRRLNVQVLQTLCHLLRRHSVTCQRRCARVDYPRSWVAVSQCDKAERVTCVASRPPVTAWRDAREPVAFTRRPRCRTRVRGRAADDYAFGQGSAPGETPALAAVVKGSDTFSTRF